MSRIFNVIFPCVIVLESAALTEPIAISSTIMAAIPTIKLFLLILSYLLNTKGVVALTPSNI